MTAAALVDTNVVFYRFDPRFPDKQARARELLRAGIADASLCLSHQTLVEFVAATTRASRGGEPLLSRHEAVTEVEALLTQFVVLYPNDAVVRSALRGMVAYQLSWFDAHMWAYAEHFGLPTLYSEDFQHDRRYGSVRIVDPFLG